MLENNSSRERLPDCSHFQVDGPKSQAFGVTAGISPCPNDTFCFESWAKGEVGEELPLCLQIADLSDLHARARGDSPLMLTKLSTACLAFLSDRYLALPVGGAFATCCGPKLVSSGEKAAIRRLAIPGLDTSAYAAFRMLYGDIDATVLPFRTIASAVRAGDVDAGILIHETGNVAEEYGLTEIADIGHEYKKKFGMSLPLGVIAVQKTLPLPIVRAICRILQASIQQAKSGRVLTSFIREHAIDTSPDIVRRHIESYVSDDTFEMSENAKSAINIFFDVGVSRGIFPQSAKEISIFHCDNT
jgi:1,4-dihydroxy-6-naphthoate synthase